MKIVAKIDETKFMVEMSEGELNRITGLDRQGFYGRSFKTGETFDVNDQWRYLSGILAKEKELLAAARNLRSLADMVESIKIPVEELKVEISGE